MKNLKKDLASGQFHRVYLLYGPESYLRLFWRDRLIKALLPEDNGMNLNILKADAVTEEEIITQADTLPFFADRRVIRLDDTGLFKLKPERGDAFRKSAELLPEYFARIPEQTVLVFCEEKADRRSRMYKAALKHGLVVEFQEADARTLSSWVLKMLSDAELRIRKSDMDYLLQKTGSDMNHVRLETDKLIHYVQSKDPGDETFGEVTRKDLDAVLSDRTENRIFDMISAVSAGRTREALDLYGDLLAGREPAMRILALLTREFNSLLLIREMMQDGEGRDAIAKALGMPPFAVRKSMDLARKSSVGELSETVSLCVQSDEDIKNGRITDRLAVELIILKASAHSNSQKK